MRTFQIEMADETPCRRCEQSLPIDLHHCPSCNEFNYRLTFEDFFGQLERKSIMDARFGGLVLGRHGPEDDIPMYRHDGDGIFSCCGLMQGGEYIVSSVATVEFRDVLEEINAEKGEWNPRSQVHVGSDSSVLNTTFLPPMGGLWINAGQFIVNRFATQKHFIALERLNALSNRNASANLD